jgi:hypothetical protein
MSKRCLNKIKTVPTHSSEYSAETIFYVSLDGASRQADCSAERGGKQEKPMRRKTEIEIEFSETVAYTKSSERFEFFCPECKTLVEMAAPPVAAVLASTTERKIYRLVETGKVHFVETDRVLICLKSLTEIPKAPPDG